MSLRKQRLCDCCGTWTQSKTLCAQCLHAGCDKKKKGEKCYLSLGSRSPLPHTLPPTPQLDVQGVEASASKGKISVPQVNV
jgi:hypothetical protein